MSIVGITGSDGTPIVGVVTTGGLPKAAVQALIDAAPRGGGTWGLGSRERIALIADGTTIATQPAGTGWAMYGLRECGPVIQHPTTGQLAAFYSAEGELPPGGTVTSSFDAKLSDDGGVTWHDGTDTPLTGDTDQGEDPFPVRDIATGKAALNPAGESMVLAEEKSSLAPTHRGINLWLSPAHTFEGHWSLYGRVIDKGAAGAFDESDCTSPLPFVWPDPVTGEPVVYCAYEGRGPGQDGQIGFARSTDWCATFTKNAEPIIVQGESGAWNDNSIVPDDVIYENGVWTLTVHAQQGADGAYQAGRYWTTDDPADWGPDSFTEYPGNPYESATDSIHMWRDDPTRAVGIFDGAFKGRWVVAARSTGSVDLSDYYTKTEADAAFLSQAEGDGRYLPASTVIPPDLSTAVAALDARADALELLDTLRALFVADPSVNYDPTAATPADFPVLISGAQMPLPVGSPTGVAADSVVLVPTGDHVGLWVAQADGTFVAHDPQIAHPFLETGNSQPVIVLYGDETLDDFKAVPQWWDWTSDADGSNQHLVPISSGGATTDASLLTTGTLPNARLDAELQALAGVTSAADTVPYFDGNGEAVLATLTAFARTLLAGADAATVRGLLGAASESSRAKVVHSAGQGSGVAASTAYQSLLTAGTATIPALATGDRIRVTGSFTWANSSGSTLNCTIAVVLGGTTLVEIQGSNAPTSGVYAGWFDFLIVQRSTSQRASGLYLLNTAARNAIGTGAVDMSSSKTLDVQAKVNNTPGGSQTLTLDHLSIEVARV